MHNVIILLATWSLVAAMIAVMAYGLRDGIRSVRQYLALQNDRKPAVAPAQAAMVCQTSKPAVPNSRRRPSSLHRPLRGAIATRRFEEPLALA